jgi:hypothetical protein
MVRKGSVLAVWSVRASTWGKGSHVARQSLTIRAKIIARPCRVSSKVRGCWTGLANWANSFSSANAMVDAKLGPNGPSTALPLVVDCSFARMRQKYVHGYFITWAVEWMADDGAAAMPWMMHVSTQPTISFRLPPGSDRHERQKNYCNMHSFQ